MRSQAELLDFCVVLESKGGKVSVVGNPVVMEMGADEGEEGKGRPVLGGTETGKRAVVNSWRTNVCM